MSKKALLMILDGWGLGDQKKDDVIFNTPTPYWDYLMNTYPHSQLQASGENVGLPDGQMGNSEVGHLNIGAGRFLEELKAENNHIIRSWSDAGLPVASAADSQALIQLQKEYCDKRKCLYCRFGYEYLRKK